MSKTKNFKLWLMDMNFSRKSNANGHGQREWWRCWVRALGMMSLTHQHFVDVEVGSVASLITPWGSVQCGADIQFVRECLAYPAPDSEKCSMRYQNVMIMGYYYIPVNRPSTHHSITAVLVLNCVKNLCLMFHTNFWTWQTSLLPGLHKISNLYSPGIFLSWKFSRLLILYS